MQSKLPNALIVRYIVTANGYVATDNRVKGLWTGRLGRHILVEASRGAVVIGRDVVVDYQAPHPEAAAAVDSQGAGARLCVGTVVRRATCDAIVRNHKKTERGLTAGATYGIC